METPDKLSKIDFLIAQGHQDYLAGNYVAAEISYKAALKLADPTARELTGRMALLFFLIADMYSEGHFAEAEALYRYSYYLTEQLPGGPNVLDESVILKRIADMCRVQSKSDMANQLSARADILLEPTRALLESIYDGAAADRH